MRQSDPDITRHRPVPPPPCRFVPVLLLLALLLCGTAAQAADEYYLATSFFRQGKYQKALDALESLEHSEGAGAVSPALLLIKAQCLASLDRQKEAIEALESLTTRSPSSSYTATARSKIAQLLEEQKNYRALIEKLKVWAAEETEEDRYTRQLAHAYVQDGHPEEAVRFLKQSKNPHALEILFDVERGLNKLPAFLAEEEKNFDGSADASRRIGALFAMNKDWRRARPYLEKARMARPGDAGLLSLMIELARSNGELENAIRYATEQVAADPRNNTNRKRLGELQLQSGHKAEALATWDRMLTAGPVDKQAYLLYITVLTDHDLVTEAIAGVEHARRIFNSPDLFAEELGKLYMRTRQPDKAAREFLRLVGTPGDRSSQLIMDLAQADAKPPPPALPASYSACVKAVLEAIEARPQTVDLYYLLDDLYQLYPDEAQVQALANTMVAHLATEFDLVVKAAKDFAAERRILEARLLYRALLPKLPGPDLWDVILDAAQLERAAGAPDDALKLLSNLPDKDAPEGGQASVQTLVAEILLDDKKEPDKARAVLQTLLTTHKGSSLTAQWNNLLARCAMAKLDFKLASTILKELENTVDNTLAPDVLYRLATIDLINAELAPAKERLQTIAVKFPAAALANRALRMLFFLSTHKEQGKAPLTSEYFAQLHAITAGRFDEYDRRAALIDPAKLPPEFKADFQMLSAQAMRARGKADAAVTVLDGLRKGLPEGPISEDALLLAAQIREKDLKDSKGARAAYEEFLLLYPSSVNADEIRLKIEGAGQRAMPTRGAETPAQ